jgi:hypothetical protein
MLADSTCLEQKQLLHLMRYIVHSIEKLNINQEESERSVANVSAPLLWEKRELQNVQF